MTIRILPMTAEHIDAVLEIEKASFARPLSRSGFERELTLPMARLRIAVDGERIVGYLNYWVIDREAHIMTLAVLPELRRSGVGQKLFASMLAETPGFASYHLELRVSNQPARAFYEHFGFRVCGVRKQYYADNHEDALLMSRFESSDNQTKARA
jgi:ribosomal-protein-alanine N-acetyltransferase